MLAAKILALAVIATVAAAVADAAQALKLLQPSPDHPGKCYDPDQQLVLAPGESLPAKQGCAEQKCLKSDTAFELLISSCGSVGAANGCTVYTPNPDAAYPQCCPSVKC